MGSRLTFSAYLKVKVTGGGGRCVYFRRYRVHSFVQGFINDLYGILSGSSTNIQTVTSKIVVGSGTSTPKITDTSLGAQIGSGSSSGQLQYNAGNIEAIVVNTQTNSATVPIARSFTNASGSSVTVSEAGILDSNGNLVLHDLLPSPVTVQPNQTLTLTYEITVTT